ncbi:MAG: tetratricopeptide repeat protein [Planctomycetes bacterium]|jgi:predicted TPR repeat methyltransferase|nr:tetratricopeptide repeat protein [Planctomycetota bacterium]
MVPSGRDVFGLDPRAAAELAMRLHREGRIDEAEEAYRQILAAAPEQPDANHFLGLLLHQRGDSFRAIALIRESLRLAPDNSHAWTNLGRILHSLGRRDEAIDAARRAAQLDPRNPAALNNLGVYLKEAGRTDEAEAALRRAIEILPDDADTHRNLGALLGHLGRKGEALDEWATAARSRDEAAPFRNLANSYYRAGRPDRAAEMVREWLRRDPESRVAKHMLAALAGGRTPDRCTEEYVRDVFDGFAETFDKKLADLGYRAPELVGEAIRRAAGPPDGSRRVLDAGCGTGLAASRLRPFAARLVGVDLSPKMLELARTRGGYDELVEAELAGYLRAHTGAFDLVASVDTLIYFGDLLPVLGAAHGAIARGGLLAFTVELAPPGTPPPGYRLNPHGRYSHTATYLEAGLVESGFDRVEAVGETLRTEAGQPVAGLVLTARRV